MKRLWMTLLATMMAVSVACANCLDWLVDVAIDPNPGSYTLSGKLIFPATSLTSTTLALDIYTDPVGSPRVFHVTPVTFLGANQTPQSIPHLLDQFGTDLGEVQVTSSGDSIYIRDIDAAKLGNPTEFVWRMTRTCAVNGNVMEVWPDWYPAPPPVDQSPSWWPDPGVPPVTDISLPTHGHSWGKLKKLYR